MKRAKKQKAHPPSDWVGEQVYASWEGSKRRTKNKQKIAIKKTFF